MELSFALRMASFDDPFFACFCPGFTHRPWDGKVMLFLHTSAQCSPIGSTHRPRVWLIQVEPTGSTHAPATGVAESVRWVVASLAPHWSHMGKDMTHTGMAALVAVVA